MKYNVYDFDGTIYNGDSTLRFYLYCLKKYPKCIIALPKTILYGIKYKLKICSKTEFKSAFYGFFRFIPNIDEAIYMFWNIEIANTKQWYIEQKKENDIIITASPEFLVKYACAKIGIEYVLGSRVDKHTGQTRGENCYGEEKVIRLLKAFSDCQIENFFSDSMSDEPLARLAECSYLVDGNKIKKWM